MAKFTGTTLLYHLAFDQHCSIDLNVKDINVKGFGGKNRPDKQISDKQMTKLIFLIFSLVTSKNASDGMTTFVSPVPPVFHAVVTVRIGLKTQ